MKLCHSLIGIRLKHAVLMLIAVLALAGCKGQPFGTVPYDAPTDVTVVDTTHHSVTLSWTDVDGAESYRVLYNSSGTDSDTYETKDFALDAQYVIDGLPAASTMFFAVQARGANGDGTISPWIEATLPGAPDVYAYDSVTPDSILNNGGTLTVPQTTVGESTQRDLILANAGPEPLHVSSVSITGHTDDMEMHDLGGTSIAVPFDIAADGTHSLRLTFAPLEVGARSIEVSIASDDPDESPMVLTITGNATPAPAPVLTATHPTATGEVALPNGTAVVDFDQIVTGTTETYYVDLHNIGDEALTVSSIVLQDAADGAFSLNSLPALPLIIPSGNQPLNRFGVVYSPQSAGSNTASLVIRSNDATNDPYTLQLQAEGVDVPPQIVVSGSSGTLSDGETIPVGEIEIGASSTEVNLSVGNSQSSTVDLTLSDATLGGANADQFRLSLQETLPVTMAPGASAGGGSTLCSLTFEPTDAGAKEATITFSSNDPDYPEFSIVVTGTAVIPAVPAAPTIATITNGEGQVDLTWIPGDSALVDYYRVYFSVTDDFSTAVQFGADGTYTETNRAATVTGLINETTYYFWVTAINLGGESAESVSHECSPQWSSAPSQPEWFNVVPGDGQFLITWGPSQRATGFRVRYYYITYLNGNPYYADNEVIEVAGHSYLATGAANGRTYHVRVSPYNETGQGTSTDYLYIEPSATATGFSNQDIALAVSSVYSSLSSTVATQAMSATDLDPDPAVIRYEFTYDGSLAGSCTVTYIITMSPTVSTTITYDFDSYNESGIVLDTATGDELTYVVDEVADGTVTGRIDISGSATGYVEYDLTITGGVLSGSYVVNGETISY